MTASPTPHADIETDDLKSMGPHDLTEEQLLEISRIFDEMREEVLNDLGAEDADYIRNVIKARIALEVAGRVLMPFGWAPPVFVAAVIALALSKILDQMEIGHNVMHGQYDWTQDPSLMGNNFEWDWSAVGDHWRHSHNYVHHTFTNVMGVDRDIGYGSVRVHDEQKWHPFFIGNPLWMVLLAFQFEGAIAIHDLGVPALIARKKSFIDTVPDIVRVLGKATRMVAKDYLFFPIISGVSAPVVLTGNLSANVIRNIWAFVVIFCGHFPDGTEVFQKEILDNETRGGWYVRQIRGTANITGTKMFHILTGNLSNQIEHHLFPDIPAVRYKALAPRVQAVCRDYDIEYNTGPLHKQFGSVVKNIFRLVKP